MPNKSTAFKQIVEIPVQVLRKGHYVSKLDRPWIDSPFLFQGFLVDNDDDLQQLRDLCASVFIEVDHDEAIELSRRQLASKPHDDRRPGDNARTISTLAQVEELGSNLQTRASQVPLKDPTPLKAELVAARTIYSETRETVTRLFDRLRRGGGLDVQSMEGAVDSMVNSIFRNREAISWLARMKSKDDYLYSHSLASSVLALAFGRHLGLDKDTLRSLGVGAMLLDIGKTQLPTALLRKPGKPDAAEWQTLRKHVQAGLDLVEQDPRADDCVKAMVRTHHERVDGSGYPSGLKGEQIPLAGRIAGIVDCYDAMTSDRFYARAISTFDAVRELKRLGKSWFQPELVDLFIQAVGAFPTGSLVELNSGEVGVVVAQNRFRRLRPEIMMVLDAQKIMRREFPVIDLQHYERGNTDGRPELWIEHGLEPGAHGIDPTEFFL